MRVGITGGRDYRNRPLVYSVMKELLRQQGAYHFVSGMARGADMIGVRAAEHLGLVVERFPADWARQGRAAGPIRNQVMVDAGLDLVIAFPGGRGTADMIQRCVAAGIPVVRFSE